MSFNQLTFGQIIWRRTCVSLFFVDSTQVGVPDAGPPALVAQVEAVIDVPAVAVAVDAAFCADPELFVVAGRIVGDVQTTTL
jgi:hypothetical protein